MFSLRRRKQDESSKDCDKCQELLHRVRLAEMNEEQAKMDLRIRDRKFAQDTETVRKQAVKIAKRLRLPTTSLVRLKESGALSIALFKLIDEELARLETAQVAETHGDRGERKAAGS